ncbi:arsenate reductase/protein-tyrosine-phosphatase family protein [Citricoccus sp. NR2]|uniref:arsenate reductase/protein-tyrosine-phosphatase family protein n=1 Tax=Citricoccus sp. NR2 TaxID=3004095 RepID=UPI0022DDAB48|nr:low molecular weight phosphatase family protein [Citricoccus sp. NR2]WBL19225.1 low molecular weight phosphatase family protein [Citricoccus sp. NR2]
MAHRILTVCTGNICRSPIAEQLLTTHLAHHDITVTSAGTHAMVGCAMPGQARHWSLLLGGHGAKEHRGVQLTAAQIQDADLVLALDRQHRRTVVELHPPASRYCFTLLEFAHIVSTMTEDTMTEELAPPGSGQEGSVMARVVALVGSMRGVVPPLDHRDDYDVVDPYLGSDDMYAHAAKVIETAVLRIAGFVDQVAHRPA